MIASAPSYAATCQHCGRVTVTAERFTSTVLARLRDHVRSVHPRENLPADAGVAETLRHYDVSAQG